MAKVSSKKKEVPTEVNNEEKAYLDKKLGKTEQTARNTDFKRLLINTDTVDNEGNDVPMDTFHILGTTLYSKEIDFRPILFKNKLIKQVQVKDKDGERWKTQNETILFDYYGDPIPDARGGLACGRVFGESAKRLSEEAQVANKAKAKAYMIMLGYATFPGAVPVLVEFRVGGKKTVDFSDKLNKKFTGKDVHYSQLNYGLSLKRAKGQKFPALTIDVDPENTLPVTSAIIAAESKAQDYVKGHNEYIMSRHKKYTGQQDAVADENDLNDSLDDLNIPE
jgi:hypothetical protein